MHISRSKAEVTEDSDRTKRVNELLFAIVAGASLAHLIGSLSGVWGASQTNSVLIVANFLGKTLGWNIQVSKFVGILANILVVLLSVLFLVFLWQRLGIKLGDSWWQRPLLIAIAGVPWVFLRIYGFFLMSFARENVDWPIPLVIVIYFVTIAVGYFYTNRLAKRGQ